MIIVTVRSMEREVTSISGQPWARRSIVERKALVAWGSKTTEATFRKGQGG
jgi:hypothetical protein